MRNSHPTPSVGVCLKYRDGIAKSLLLFMLFIAAVFNSKPAYAASISLAWDANTESSLAGYKIYYGTASRVYGTSIDVGNQTSYTVSNLATGTYYFAVTAYSTSGQESDYSNEVSQTLTSTTDTTPPSITITAPASGATVSSTITVSANASDDVGIAGVQFILNGSNLGTEDTSSPYAVSWNTTTVANGTYALSAKAKDAAGNTSTASVSVTVSNAVSDTTPPSVTMTAPVSGATLSSTVTVSANASDNVGVAGVQFQLDGLTLGTEDTSSPYSISWDTTKVAYGTHTLSAKARDAAGNTSTASVSVTVFNSVIDTSAPSITITVPASGATLSNTVTVSANASDNVGVAGVQFILNGSILGSEDTSSPYSVSWNTTTVANGTYTLSAKARDASGNTSISTVNVTVSNTVAITGLVGGFPFSEGTGSNTADVSGNGNTGTIFGATWSKTGKFGSALSFSRKDYVSAGVSKMPAANAPQTVAVWFNATSVLSVQNLIVLANKSAGSSVQLGFRNSRITVWQNGGTVLLSADSPTVNAWHHVAYTFDGSIHRLYLDGTLVATSNLPPQTAPVATLEFGRLAGNREFYFGLLDEVRIYSRALGQSEIRSIMTAPLGSTSVTPVRMSLAGELAPDALAVSAGTDTTRSDTARTARVPSDNAITKLSAVSSTPHSSSVAGKTPTRLPDPAASGKRDRRNAGPTVSVKTNRATYTDGDSVEASMHLSNPSPNNRPVEIKTWITVPGSASISIGNVGADRDYVLVPGFDETYNLSQLLPSALHYPAGIYDLSSRIIDPITGELVFEDRSAFTLSHSVSPSSDVPPTAADGPTVFIQPESADRNPGSDPSATILTVQNTGTKPISVEVKSWLELAGSASIPLVSAGADGSIVLQPGSDFAFAPLAGFNPTARFAAGIYVVRSRALDVTTGKILAEDFSPITLR